jgi:hypothetical protein
MDECVGEYRLRTAAVVCALEPGRKIVWQLKSGITLPVWVTLDLADDAAGVVITHTIEAGFRGLGRLFDPLLYLYLSLDFERAVDEHVRTEFPKLRDFLRSADKKRWRTGKRTNEVGDVVEATSARERPGGSRRTSFMGGVGTHQGQSAGQRPAAPEIRRSPAPA